MFSLFASSLTEVSTLNESNLMIFGESGFYAALIVLLLPIPVFVLAMHRDRFKLSIFVSTLATLTGIALFILTATSVPEPTPTPLMIVTPLFVLAVVIIAFSSYLAYDNRRLRSIGGGQVPEDAFEYYP